MVTLKSVSCQQCKSLYKEFLQRYNQNIKRNRKFYCSTSCRDLSNKKGYTTNCVNCSKEIYHLPSAKNKFCSRRCSGLYNNSHKTKGIRRSKLEIWIESKLLILYPNLLIDFNRKDTIGSELDIYIPSLKLAFELNGIFHYEPIYGNKKLEYIQNNDLNKFQTCQLLGISLCTINTSSPRHFKESTSKKFLDIITSIIGQAEACLQTEPREGY